MLEFTEKSQISQFTVEVLFSAYCVSVCFSSSLLAGEFLLSKSCCLVVSLDFSVMDEGTFSDESSSKVFFLRDRLLLPSLLLTQLGWRLYLQSRRGNVVLPFTSTCPLRDRWRVRGEACRVSKHFQVVPMMLIS